MTMPRAGALDERAVHGADRVGRCRRGRRRARLRSTATAPAETPGWVTFDESMFGEPFLATAGGGGDVGHDVVVVWIPAEQRGGRDRLEHAGGHRRGTAAGDRSCADDWRAAATAASRRRDRSGSSCAARAGRTCSTAATRSTVHATSTVSWPSRPTAPTRSRRCSHCPTTCHRPTWRRTSATSSHCWPARRKQGREELELLEADLRADRPGRQLAGTIVDDGELRTYVTIMPPGESMLLWYALDDEGGIAAVEGPTAAAVARASCRPTTAATARTIRPAATPDVTVGSATAR